MMSALLFFFGGGGGGCSEQNHTAKPNSMLCFNHFDDSVPDRTVLKQLTVTIDFHGMEKKNTVEVNDYCQLLFFCFSFV